MSNDTWICPNCGKLEVTSNFCPDCGTKKPESLIWNCPNCGKDGLESNFCPNCGTKKPSASQNNYYPMSKEELMKIERWTESNDSRTDSELLEDVGRYLANAELLKNYMIVRNVPPETFNADATILKNYVKYYGDMGENSRGEKYSANKYGRPVSFVIKDAEGNIKMMIMVAKDSSFSHWLVKWCWWWCQDHNIPLLKLHTGAANTEHYVVRRVYEILGLTKTSVENIAYRNPKTGQICYRETVKPGYKG